jgi:hypothetical protein
MNAAKLKQIYGSQLGIRALDGADTIIKIPPKPPDGWPRTGVEAFGLKVDLDVKRSGQTASHPAFLKIFKTAVREREQRVRLLIEMGLAKQHGLFSGIPFGWLGRLPINGVDIIAHCTRMIGGPPEDFGRLRQSKRWMAFDQKARQRFAAELAVAVAGLERAGIVHGDISPGNILVGQINGKGMCILCDYDGYSSHLAPRLPRKDDNRLPCRPLGSPGYQYPDLIAALKQDQHNEADIWVETDRFALGVAICEMMVWSNEIEALLQKEGREEFLSRDLIAKRDLSRLPRDVIASFPKGFNLLDKALHVAGPAAMPSPEDWLRVLGFEDDAVEFKGSPLITAARMRGTSRSAKSAFRLLHQDGDFGKANPEFAGTGYRFFQNKLELRFAKGPVKRRRHGRLADVTADFDSVIANPGDIFYVGEWEFEIFDSSDGA